MSLYKGEYTSRGRTANQSKSTEACNLHCKCAIAHGWEEEGIYQYKDSACVNSHGIKILNLYQINWDGTLNS